MAGLSRIFSLPRRGFFRFGIGSAAGLLAAPAFARALEGYKPENLTEAELLALTAIMSRLIPADDKHGGAVEARAYVYVDRALGGYHSRHLETYRLGLADFDRLARKSGAGSFAMLPAEEMDQLIGDAEDGVLAGGAFSDGGKAFFGLFRRHTVEGFLCDPMYGGNSDFLGWEVIGYPGVQLYYSDQAQELNGKDDREHRSIADFGGKAKP